MDRMTQPTTPIATLETRAPARESSGWRRPRRVAGLVGAALLATACTSANGPIEEGACAPWEGVVHLQEDTVEKYGEIGVDAGGVQGGPVEISRKEDVVDIHAVPGDADKLVINGRNVTAASDGTDEFTQEMQAGDEVVLEDNGRRYTLTYSKDGVPFTLAVVKACLDKK
jgi:hypothetical protein